MIEDDNIVFSDWDVSKHYKQVLFVNKRLIDKLTFSWKHCDFFFLDDSNKLKHASVASRNKCHKVSYFK